MKYKEILSTKNYTKGINSKKILVIHHTGTAPGTIQSVINKFQDSSAQVSAHYVVDELGYKYKFNNEDSILWHAGESWWNGYTGLNNYSIGIEVIGPGFNDAQRASVDELIIDIIKRNNISYENVVRHKDITQYNGNSLLGKEWTYGSLSRKVDIADSFWNTKYATWGNYKNYLFSKLTIMNTVGFYENLFKSKGYNTEDLIIKDVDGLIEKCINKDGTLNAKEFTYAMLIGLQRLNSKITLV